MTDQQLTLFLVFGGILGLLVWGRFRYDLVAAGGLFLAVALGLVPDSEAFSGFANPAVVIVALVLIASRAFENSGMLGLLADKAFRTNRPVPLHIALTAGFGSLLSSVINNVAALALLMPLDVQAARKAERPPGFTLMPLAFATILGGMITLIGTPPNIIASTFRAERLGAPYQMFDFAPVGLAVAGAGLLFVALIGWRLMPRRGSAKEHTGEPSHFFAELLVPEGSPAIGKIVVQLEEEAEENDVLVIGLIRGEKRYLRQARFKVIEEGDVLIVEGSADGLADFIKSLGLQESLEDKQSAKHSDDDEVTKSATVVEAVVRADSMLVGRSATYLRLRTRFGATVLGISRSGTLVKERVHSRAIEAGDMLLLTGAGAARESVLDALGVIAVSRTNVAPVDPVKVTIAIACFIGAIALAAIGYFSFAVAIAVAVAIYGATGLVRAREFYTQVEWPVVVMLACLLPLGEAFDRLGCTQLIAGWLLSIADGQPPIVMLAIFMAAVMTLSDVLNNVATMVIAAPLSIEIANTLGANPDTFLMGAAVATSCAFLSPIGHKNNTLIMGPGGYRFGDYWRMGLPLEIIVLAVGVPMLSLVWPL